MAVTDRIDALKARFGEQGADDLLGQLIAAADAEAQADAAGVEHKAGDAAADVADEDAETTDEDDEETYIGDMTPEAFTAFLTPILAAALQGAGQAATKATDAQGAALTAARQEIAQLNVARTKADADHADQVAKLDARLKALEGDVPTGVHGFRASESASTVTAEKSAPPAPDPEATKLSELGAWLMTPGGATP